MPQSVTQTVTWAPVRFPLRWAEGSDDAPSWDGLAGFPPELYMPFTTKLAEQPHVIKSAVSTVWYETIGQNADRSSVRAANERHNTGRLTFPILVADYPLLLDRFDVPDLPFTQAVNRLAESQNDLSRFKVGVLDIASSYSLLADAHSSVAYNWSTNGKPLIVPSVPYGDSITDWRRAVIYSRTHLEVARVLADEERRKSSVWDLDAIMDEVLLSLPEKVRTLEVKQQLERIKNYLKSKNLETSVDISDAEYQQAVKANGYSHVPVQSAGEALARLHTLNWQRFAVRARFEYLPSPTYESPKDLYLVNGGQTWMFYELALAFKHSSELRRCEGCGVPFFPRRKDARYCNPLGKSACRVKASRRRNKSRDAA